MSTPPYVCSLVQDLPFGGSEILVLSLIFMTLSIVYCVTFFDVAIKQIWPEARDPAVQKRIEEIQTMYPSLGQPPAESDEDEESNEKTKLTIDQPVKTKAGDTPAYNRLVSQAPYIAGLSVDEDLIPVLANNQAFETVSEYCSSTVRGYAILSGILLVAGISLGYLWVHNVKVDPVSADDVGKWAIVGYVLVIMTGVVMCGPNDYAVNRNANIAMWSNIPLKIEINGKMTRNPLLSCHEIGICSFVLIPFLTHGYRALRDGPESMPNKYVTLFGCGMQLGGAILMGLCMCLKGKISWLSVVEAKKWCMVFEIVCVFSSFVAYLQYEFYPTAYCQGYGTQYNQAVFACSVAPLIIIAKHYYWAPTTFPTPPSVLLCQDSTPVATAGPVPVLQYDQENMVLPHLN